MKYELQLLDELITVSLKPINCLKQKNKGAFFKAISASISLEADKVCRSLITGPLECGNDGQVKSFIRMHQFETIKLMDTIQSYLSKKGSNSFNSYPSLKSFIHALTNLLQKVGSILNFIEHNFPGDFDYNFKIPEQARLNIIPEIKDLIALANTKLIEAGIDTRLTHIVVIPFNYLLNDDNKINYKDLNYLVHYKQEMTIFLEQNEISPVNIYSLLIRLNLNDPTFAFYYIEKVKQADTIDSAAGRMEYYYLQLKIINQASRKPGIIFDNSLPSIHDQLGTWLAEEIYFLEKRQLLEFVPIAKNDTEAKPVKVHTTLSVAHLSFAIKLLQDTKIIKNKNASEIIRMVSKSFRTEMSEQISEDSLRNKSYNIESSAIEGVKNVIIGLLNEVRKY